MGQKVHPLGMRLGITETHRSMWYADSRNYPSMLYNDLITRKFLKKALAQAYVSRIQIERPAKNARITVYSARPGVVIG
ncbi:MAG TPA: KH domain-containing protein, partial [Gammaproteobacteria bacterium]|nr:KH domain-containing protein [Gammaproteobacteria bacterium]